MLNGNIEITIRIPTVDKFFDGCFDYATKYLKRRYKRLFIEDIISDNKSHIEPKL